MMEDAIRKVFENVVARVRENGFTVLAQLGSEDEPGFAYTVGLSCTLAALPELIIMGLAPPIAQRALSIIAERLRAGEELPIDTDIQGVFSNKLPVRLRTIAPDRFIEYGLWAQLYRKDVAQLGDLPRTLQVLWPNGKGQFPGDPAYKLRRLQPLL